MRFLYTILIHLLLPLALLYLWFRSLKQPEYRRGFSQRLGLSGPEVSGDVIWVHGASVGEVTAAVPMIRRLLSAYPDKTILVTTVTPTGAQRVRDNFGDQVEQCYLPLDAGFAVRGFLKRYRPELAIIMETEIWPTLYYELDQQSIPVVIASGRLSQKSVDGYGRFKSLISHAMRGNVRVAAQTQEDRERFIGLGLDAGKAVVTGNIKFDFDPPEGMGETGAEFRERHLCQQRPVWVAASTHEGEEEQVLKAHAALLQKVPDALLLLVPRHPERFDDVANLIRKAEFSSVRRSSNQICDPRSEVFLGDVMGEMMTFYAASDVAFVGGSLVDIGGHNLLEPASLGKPILTGSSNHNSQDVADMLIAAGALQTVDGPAELAVRLEELFNRPSSCDEMGSAALTAINNSRGALDRLMELITPLIRPKAES